VLSSVPDATAGSVVELELGPFRDAVDRRLATWRQDRFLSRYWAKDPTLWGRADEPEIADRMGWLAMPERMRAEVGALLAFAGEVRARGVRDVVVLGMGGSSLAPELFGRFFGGAPGAPRLTVLDSTHPDWIRAVRARLDLARSLFLVSSKSGSTTETLSFFRYFWAECGGGASAGDRFVAITDPGTPLEALARERKFLRVFPGPPDVGGRYSALTVFGLVPAALVGAPVGEILAEANRMALACGPASEPGGNPGLLLGAALGELGRHGRNKVTFLDTPEFEAFSGWTEQLIAESTGKAGRGLVPVVGEPARAADRWGSDRLFVTFEGPSPPGRLASPQAAALRAAGHPVVRLRWPSPATVGAHFFLWEFAVAAAGNVLGIQPFNQPDVQLAKDLARRAMAGPRPSTDAPEGAGPGPADPTALARWVRETAPGGYVGVHAYLAPTEETRRQIDILRARLAALTSAAVTFGFGPRFLHSTGQLHKGGPPNGRFVQLTDRPRTDVPVPETDFTFGRLIEAQAHGDASALRQRGQDVLAVGLGSDPRAVLDALLSGLAERATL
jgi:transaldolase/glucose-6-phosphate isomerase